MNNSANGGNRGGIFMREIKFRAWDTLNKKMHDWEQIRGYWDIDALLGGQWEGFGGGNHPWNYPIPMQYTGIKDKKDVEIYEGDIISGWVSAHSHSGRDKVLKIVKYQVDRARYNFDAIDVFVDDKEYLEVIGNIYENPELIKLP